MILTISSAITEEAWDAFLKSTPLGQFQQSSMWARYKSAQGWNCIRVAGKRGEDFVGGYQLLWRRSRWGKLAYISKGPVVTPGSQDFVTDLIEGMVKMIHQEKFDFVMAQPPDFSQGIDSALIRSRFRPDTFMGIIRGGLTVDVGSKVELIHQRMRHDCRQRIKQARNRGVEIFEGDQDRLGVFFELMLRTCERQRVRPNPASERDLKELWNSFGARANLRLTFASVDGKIVSGQLAVIFGKRVTIWKKGWTSENSRCSPNHSITFETFEWAHRNGFEMCDFAGLNREIAEALLAGKGLTEKQRRSRDCFNLGFGGVPVLLPAACVYFRNPVLRWVYKVGISLPGFQPLMKRMRLA